MLKTVYGTIAITHTKVEQVELPDLRQIVGDIRIVDNKKLTQLRVRSDLQVWGCVKVQDCPLLELPKVLRVARQCES